MSNSIFNNDEITIANGVHNPMLKDLDANGKNIGDVKAITCDDITIDQTLTIGGGITITGGATIDGGLTLTGGNLEATGVAGNFDEVNAGGIITAGSSITTGGDITSTTGNITATIGNVNADGDITSTTGNINATAGNVNAGVDVVAVGSVNAGAVNAGSMILTTTAQIGTNCNVGENLAFVLQGGAPTHNIVGAYAVNNAPALEMYFQSGELVGQHGVATLRSSNGAISGVVNKIVVDADQGIHIACDNGPIILDTGGVGMVDLDNNERIINCVNPINAQDVATKDYVDTEIDDAHGSWRIDPATIVGADGTGDISVFYSVGIACVLDVETITYRKYEIHLQSGVAGTTTITQGDTNGNPVGGSNMFYYGGVYVNIITISAGELWTFYPSKQSATPSRLYYLVNKVI